MSKGRNVWLTLFTRKLAILLNAGVPLLEALESLATHEEDERMKTIVEAIIRKLEGGHSLQAALLEHPKIFSQAYVAMIAAGENSGKITLVLHRLSHWLEESGELASRVCRALTYPAFTLLTSFGLLVLLFWTIVPGMLETVAGIGAELPWPTLVVARLSECFRNPLCWVLGVLSLLPLVRYSQTEAGKRELYSVLCGVPGVGPAVIYSGAARYAATLALLIRSGTNLLDAVPLAARASGSPSYAEDSKRISNLLKEGIQLSEAWAKPSKNYPPLLVTMMVAAEESGSLVETLEKAAELMKREANFRIQQLTIMLEPLLLGAVSVVVGFIVVSLMLPITNIVSGL